MVVSSVEEAFTMRAIVSNGPCARLSRNMLGLAYVSIKGSVAPEMCNESQKKDIK